MNIKISVCNKRTDKKYKNQEQTWEYLKGRNRSPLRTTETAEEYPRLSKAQKDAAKDHGGFVGGWLKGGIRKNGNVLGRQIGCLDADKIPQGADFPFLVELALDDTEYFIYSTHSHTADSPRYRLVILLAREVSEDEYPAVMRMAAKQIGMGYFDDSTYQANRMMYWASCPSNGDFAFHENAGKPLDPDKYLGMYKDWKDVSQWPTSKRQSEVIQREMQTQQDPTTKSGVIGAFCRVYDIESAIENFLPDVYAPSAAANRYDYIPADSAAGVVLYEGKWAYSHHASDPACEKLLNAFDLVRIHRFGDEEGSLSKMSEFAVADAKVNAALLQERKAEAERDFADADSLSVDWIERLQRKKDGTLVNNLRNIILILQNEPKLKGIVFNQLADGMEIKTESPWRIPDKESRFWRDADDAQLISYIDSYYGTFSQANYNIAVTKVTDDRSYHPIREYLESLPPWDNTPRLETLLVKYLRAEDNEYTRTVTRKAFCAAVARVYKPGIKFDNILVLNGPQGAGKSTLISKLGGEWYSDSLQLTDMNDKTAAEKLQGYWLLEIGELAGMRKAEIDKVKAFISRQDDKYRASFGRRVTPHPRQCVFFGTTNTEKGYLRDVTGNRRFWTVKTPGGGEMQSWQLSDDEVSQIWAEALCLFRAGERLYLSAELEAIARGEQREAMEQDEREGLVRTYLDTPLPSSWDSMDIYKRREFISDPNASTMPIGEAYRETVSNIEIWCECFGKRKEDIQPKDSYAIAAIMERIEGWEKQTSVRHLKHYGGQRVYLRLQQPDLVARVVEEVVDDDLPF